MAASWEPFMGRFRAIDGARLLHNYHFKATVKILFEKAIMKILCQGPSKAKQCKAMQSKAMQSNAKRSKASKAKQSKAK